MKLQDIQRDKRALIIGAGGTGKTHLIGTLCQLLPTLVVTSDRDGLETLSQMKLAHDPGIILIEDWKQVWPKFKEIIEGATTYQAIALDDFGSMQSAARHKIERMPQGWKEERVPSKELEATIRRELLMGERRLRVQDWGSMWTAMESFLYEVLLLPYAVKLVTVLEQVRSDPRTGEDRIYPNLQGDIRTSISARFSFVAESFLASDGSNLQYCLSSRPHPRVETKDRFVSGGRTWIDPEMAKILAHMAGKGENESEQEKKIGSGI